MKTFVAISALLATHGAVYAAPTIEARSQFKTMTFNDTSGVVAQASRVADVRTSFNMPKALSASTNKGGLTYGRISVGIDVPDSIYTTSSTKPQPITAGPSFIQFGIETGTGSAGSALFWYTPSGFYEYGNVNIATNDPITLGVFVLDSTAKAVNISYINGRSGEKYGTTVNLSYKLLQQTASWTIDDDNIPNMPLFYTSPDPFTMKPLWTVTSGTSLLTPDGAPQWANIYQGNSDGTTKQKADYSVTGKTISFTRGTRP